MRHKSNVWWHKISFYVIQCLIITETLVVSVLLVANIDIANWYNSKHVLLNCNLFQCKVRFESFIIEYFCFLFEVLSSRLDTNMRTLEFKVGIVRHGYISPWFGFSSNISIIEFINHISGSLPIHWFQFNFLYWYQFAYMNNFSLIWCLSHSDKLVFSLKGTYSWKELTAVLSDKICKCILKQKLNLSWINLVNEPAMFVKK